MKKIWAVLLCVSMLLALAACNKSPQVFSGESVVANGDETQRSTEKVNDTTEKKTKKPPLLPKKQLK